ncbi:hypothetical protein [Vibrio panuliri]|uniref:hypothetical protein n=1 Tax=Vibrio panuliri TaxID=1381081 RepID=UPI0013867822|nr:hypothetical protein [Vibrio panuliri]
MRLAIQKKYDNFDGFRAVVNFNYVSGDVSFGDQQAEEIDSDSVNIGGNFKILRSYFNASYQFFPYEVELLMRGQLANHKNLANELKIDIGDSLFSYQRGFTINDGILNAISLSRYDLVFNQNLKYGVNYQMLMAIFKMLSLISAITTRLISMIFRYS